MKKIEKELADLKAEVKEKTLKWENEKKSISGILEIKKQIEKTKQMMKEAEREVNYTRLAELQYGEMTHLEQELKKEEERPANYATEERDRLPPDPRPFAKIRGEFLV